MFLLKLFCNVPEGSGSWKYNMYFPADEVTRKTYICMVKYLSEQFTKILLDYAKEAVDTT